MKNFGKLALLGAALAVSATSAFATTPVLGSLQFAGAPDSDVSYTGTGSNITLTFNTPAEGTVGIPITGTFVGVIAAGLTGVDTVTVPTTVNTLSLPSTPLVTITQGTNVVTFTATSDVVSYDSSGYADITFYGTTTETGYSNNPISTLVFDTHSVAGGSANSYSGALTAGTPEPSSLILLGTGLLSAGGMLARRRRLTA